MVSGETSSIKIQAGLPIQKVVRICCRKLAVSGEATRNIENRLVGGLSHGVPVFQD